MAAEPRKIFDLMDTETEPTDEQLAELMHYVGEAVRARKEAIRSTGSGNNYAVKESQPPPYGV